MTNYAMDPEGFVRKTSPEWAGSSEGCKPVVVIDPEDAEQMTRLAQAWDDVKLATLGDKPMPLRAYRMQAALRSLVVQPKPDAPAGIGAVVEDDCGDFWVRLGHGPDGWKPANTVQANWTQYTHISVVRVLSPGIAPTNLQESSA